MNKIFQNFSNLLFLLKRSLESKIKSLSGGLDLAISTQYEAYSDSGVEFINSLKLENKHALEDERVLFIESSVSFKSETPLAKFFFDDFNRLYLHENNIVDNSQVIAYTRTEIRCSSAMDFLYDENTYDLIVCRMNNNRAFFNFETVIYENLYPILSEKGVLSVQMDASFSTEGIEKLFSDDAYFELTSFSESGINNNDHVLLHLRKKPIAHSKRTRSLYLPLSDKEFYLKDIELLYTSMLEKGCNSKTSSDFAADIKNNISKGKFLVKHDIHHDLRRTLNFAEMEADLGIQSVYFAMPEHELTEHYFDTKYMWNVFEKITQMGHEIAFHLDLHDLILRYGGLLKGVDSIINTFNEKGFKIKTANLHGNTLYRKLYGSPKAFLKKRDADIDSIRHIYPICHDDFLKYYATVSLESLGRDFGIENWIDTEFFKFGMNLRVPTNCSDNTGAIKFGNRSGNIYTSEKYHLSGDFCENVAAHCSETTTVFLLHPQYYELP